MSGEILFLGGLLAVTIALFVTEKLRLDLVAVGVIVTLAISGILTPGEAVAGFGNPVVVLIAALFVIGEGLRVTGVARAIGDWILRKARGGERGLMLMLASVAAGLSAFMSSTGAVAIFIPITFSLAAKAKVAPSRLLLPLAYGALVGGMLTLIGTPPNLVVSTELERSGLQPFGFFGFTPIGLVLLAVTLGYLVVYGQRRLRGDDGGQSGGSETSIEQLARDFDVWDRVDLLRVEAGSPLAGRTLAGARLQSRIGFYVLAIERRSRLGQVYSLGTRPGTLMRTNDILLAVRVNGSGEHDDLDEQSLDSLGLKSVPVDGQHAVILQEIGIVPASILPEASLIGRTLAEANFRVRYGLSALAIRRGKELLKGNLSEVKLAFGDTMLLGGTWKRIDQLRQDMGELALLRLPRERDDAAPSYRQAWLALGILGLMLVVMTLNLMPAVVAVLLCAVLMLLGRCLTMQQAYASVNWEGVVLIAGMLPMATAMQKTGAMNLIVDQLVASLGSHGPYAMMAGLFLLTAVFSQFISNTATTVLVAPIALGAASKLGVSPYPLLMTVAMAASAAFVTPVASPVNTLVLGPGGYRFADFVKVGLPLLVLALATTLLVVPLLYPLK